MKKFIGLALIGAMMLTVAGCSKKEVKVISKIDDLKDAKIGVQVGTTGYIYVEDEFGKENTVSFDNGYNAVLALKNHKIDAVIIDDQPAQVFVEKNEGIKILDEEFVTEDYAIAIKKGNTELKDKVNEALAEIKANGTFQNSVDYYIEQKEGSAPYEKKEVERVNGKLTVATNAAFPPYEYKEGENFVGLDIDMAQAIADYLQMELVVLDMDFNSILASVDTGKADLGIAGMTVSEERLENVDFSDTYYTGRQVVIVNE